LIGVTCSGQPASERDWLVATLINSSNKQKSEPVMKRLLLAALAAITLAILPQAAEARQHYGFHHVHHYRVRHHHRAYGRRYVAETRSESEQGFGFFQSFVEAPRAVIHGVGRAVETIGRGIVGGRPSGCPHAYCGCGTSLYFFHRIVPDLNLAANWLRFPHVSHGEPGTAAVAPGRHHVLAVVADLGGGRYMVHDSNSGGGLTRDHVRNLTGYTFVRPS
jgi:hypothetical protein